ncbi:MAG: hypothetical protein GF341_13655 [candidate division Zixibacteria bacterium]|nr:hypothetical protein [candidate division Zixibacteria bacterium]
MPRHQTHTLGNILARVALAYVVVFGIWLLVAPVYHLLLARTAGVFIPMVANAQVQRIWLEDTSDADEGVGAHFRIRFEGKDRRHTEYTHQTLGITTDTTVDIRQFGYPIVTFLALALGVRLPRRWSDLRRILLGSAVMFVIFALWVLIEVYQYVAAQDVVFLRENLIAQLIPSTLYREYRIPLITYFGQVIPICVYGALYTRLLLSHDASANEMTHDKKGVPSDRRLK